MLPFLTATLSLISRTSQFRSAVPACSQRTIWYVCTTKFRWNLPTSRRLPLGPLLRHLASLSSYTHAVRSPQCSPDFPAFYRPGATLPFVYAYLDDLLIASTPAEEHHAHLRQVLQRLSDHGMIVNPTKCVFGVFELDFLGHRVTADGIKPLDDKVNTVHNRHHSVDCVSSSAW